MTAASESTSAMADNPSSVSNALGDARVLAEQLSALLCVTSGGDKFRELSTLVQESLLFLAHDMSTRLVDAVSECERATAKT